MNDPKETPKSTVQKEIESVNLQDQTKSASAKATTLEKAEKVTGRKAGEKRVPAMRPCTISFLTKEMYNDSRNLSEDKNFFKETVLCPTVIEESDTIGKKIVQRNLDQLSPYCFRLNGEVYERQPINWLSQYLQQKFTNHVELLNFLLMAQIDYTSQSSDDPSNEEECTYRRKWVNNQPTDTFIPSKVCIPKIFILNKDGEKVEASVEDLNALVNEGLYALAIAQGRMLTKEEQEKILAENAKKAEEEAAAKAADLAAKRNELDGLKKKFAKAKDENEKANLQQEIDELQARIDEL